MGGERLKHYEEGIIISNEEVGPNIYKLVLKGNFHGKPGQFYMIRGWNGLDPFLARPLSIADLEDGRITFLYELRGRGTHIISKLGKGDNLSILGPLGNGFDYGKKKGIALVSGGIGIAPMYYLSKSLLYKGDLFAGFRDNTFFLDEFKEYIRELNISTEDGSIGHKGYIVDILNPEEYDLIMACGPTPMLKAILEKCQGKAPVYISMESHMGCGIGTCLGCTINTVRGIERVCKEGPVFLGEELVFND